MYKKCCEQHNHNHCGCDKGSRNMLYVRLFVSFLIFLIGFRFKWLFLAAYVIVGGDILYKAIRNLFRGRVFDENFLMSIATVGAICIRKFPEAYMVMFLYQIGEMLQDRAVDKSRESISALMAIRPDFANVVKDGDIVRVSPEEVNVNDIIIVKPGEKVPLDGVIIEGEGLMDTSSLTGESFMKIVRDGSDVFSGMINTDSLLKIRVTKSFSESTVSKILQLVENAQLKKANTERFITRFAKVYTPIVVVLALLLATVPGLVFPGNWIERALTFLVISCPCAFVIAVPLSFFAGIGRASKEGILVKGSVYLEKLHKTNFAVFDKTGTLTKAEFNVTGINSEDFKILKYAALAESASNHPIAIAIKKAYGRKLEILDTKEYPGLGVKAFYHGDVILVGNSKFIGVPPIKASGIVVYVSYNDKYLGNIVISDVLKEDSKKLISELDSNDINTIMFTGDSQENAEFFAEELGIKRVYADLMPQDKVMQLEELMSDNDHGNVVFMGDGINDAPVLSRADVGISMGGIGSDAAIAASDVVFMNDNPYKLIDAIKISKKTMQIVYQNIIFAIGVKVLFLILSTFGLMTMWGAVFADVGVTVIAIFNALRLMK